MDSNTSFSMVNTDSASADSSSLSIPPASDFEALTRDVGGLAFDDASPSGDQQTPRLSGNARRRQRRKKRTSAEHDDQAEQQQQQQSSTQTDPSESQVWANNRWQILPVGPNAEPANIRNSAHSQPYSPPAGQSTSHSASVIRAASFQHGNRLTYGGPPPRQEYVSSYARGTPQFETWANPQDNLGWSEPGNAYAHGGGNSWYVNSSPATPSDEPDHKRRRLSSQEQGQSRPWRGQSSHWRSQFSPGRNYQSAPSMRQQQHYRGQSYDQPQYPRREYHAQDHYWADHRRENEQAPPTPKPRPRNDRTFEKRQGPTRPSPEAAYLEAATAPPNPAIDHLPHPRPLLIVVDLNGTLITRKQRSAARSGNFTLRASARAFLDYALAAHRLLVWTSATPESVAAIRASGGLFRDSTEEARVLGFWTREQLRLSPAAYRSKVQVYKRLEWVWDDEAVQRAHPGYARGERWSAADTVLVDDSVEKAAAQPHNLVLVPEMEAAEERLAEAERPLVKAVELLKELSLAADVSKELARRGMPQTS